MTLQGLAMVLWGVLGVGPDDNGEWIQTLCIAKAVYHEARGEPEAGQHAVAWVVLNRVADRRWPSNPCAVVYQRHQFAWTRHNPPIYEHDAFEDAMEIAALVQHEWRSSDDPWLWFYDPSEANPRWARRLAVKERIGDHVFLSDP